MKAERSSRVTIAALLCALAVACASAPVTREKYQKDELTFTHLSNWVVKSDNLLASGNARVVTVEGPHNTVLTISRFPSANPITLDDYVARIEERRGSIIEKRTAGIVSQKNGQNLGNVISGMIAGKSRDGVTQSFDLSLLSLVTHFRADFFMIEDSRYKWVLMAQTPVEQREQVEQGLQLIYDSLSFNS